MNWNDYELVLKASDSKECEVTGRDMGGDSEHVCPIGKMEKDQWVEWTPEYGGFDTVKVTFLGTDGESVLLNIYKSYNRRVALKPGEEWKDNWCSGEWSYHVKIWLREKEDAGKPFFVHTFTDDGVTSDYADAKEAYENR